ncbi:ThuA domain-containing protein [Cellvibrio sp. OA-2007]|uniref:ThuA domain-containing protein n=1 Tax=Cellvibrio sp. OA-2007 TaxID=529823 RepID=UPI000780C980|nr:ThuA domain-containing protein [Cellvibrio sp. OA-2007]
MNKHRFNITHWCVYIVGLTILSVSLASCGENANSSVQQSSLKQAASPSTEQQQSISGATILVFSKTAGWRHDSIPAGIAAFQKLAEEHQFTVVASEDASLFTDAELSQFNAIVFLNTTLNVLDENQELAMERYIQAGGGFVGIHAAADTEWEGDWFWYRNLVGAVFKNHPNSPSNVQQATVNFVDQHHASTASLAGSISVADEWYNYRDMYEFINVVATVDESTYQGGEHGHNHPISWYHDYDGGRAFYTGMGHTSESFSNPDLLQHLLGGLTYAVGLNHRTGFKPRLDYSKSRPEPNRFVKKTLVENLDEPVKLAFFPNGDALIALRPGKFQRVDYKTGQLSDAGTLTVAYDKFQEWGLVGVAVDPDFATNQTIYAAFTVKDDAGNPGQRLSRFLWRNNQVDASTEEKILQYPIDNNCCHTGGDLQFGSNGELFFSTGDNTNPHDQDGYAPVDFRPDMKKNDGLRAPGNTQDLRGKVLRIIPKKDGGYDVPAGNLFTDPAQGRPEIYVMGARNPYSITYDHKTSTLFYGDVGPDASNDSDEKGSRGYDEINRVTAAGNFGWPLVIGQNKPYKKYDYITQKTGEWVSPQAPVNDSPNNTGAKQLPPAQPAFIAYPYGVSDEFPEMGTGGRTALVADVYHSEDYPESVNRYPAYYDNSLFILDFMRAWVKVVSFDVQGRIKKIEPFAPQISYALPIDSRFAPDGTLYVLEYGMSWFTGNPDARLARIEYVGPGNRPPVANITLDKTQSGIPAQIRASAKQSIDLDGDKMTYAWKVQCAEVACVEQRLGDAAEINVSLEKAGEYTLELTVSDTNGAKTTLSKKLDIGNEPPVIEFASPQNQSFYWPDTQAVDYSFSISDKEDGVVTSIADANPLIQFSYTEPEKNAGQGHQTVNLVDRGKALVDANNCLGCHKLDEKMVGPAFRDVAKKYQKDPKALQYLVNKLGNGGAGVWGEMNMPAFSGLSEADRSALATYVLSLAENNALAGLPLSGKVELKSHQKNTAAIASDKPYSVAGEAYVFTIQYTDNGANNLAPISVAKKITLIPPRLDFDSVFNAASATKEVKQDTYNEVKTIKVLGSQGVSGFGFGRYDLTSVTSVKVGALFFKERTGWLVEIRRDSLDGEVIGSGTISPLDLKAYDRTSITLKSSRGFADLYIKIQPEKKTTAEVRLQDISFEK